MKIAEKIRYTSSLASRLMRSVFGIYLLIAISLTAIQLFMQFLNEQSRHYQQMNHVATTFSPILAQAMWDFNDEQLQATMFGLLVSPEISGISIVDIEGQVTKLGEVDKKQERSVIGERLLRKLVKVQPSHFYIGMKIIRNLLVLILSSIIWILVCARWVVQPCMPVKLCWLSGYGIRC